ncbi:MAG: CDC48 family AAA ATPase [Candidatus Woesearchaeota archaeon]
MDEAKEIKLKVMESVQDDVNKGVVKVDTSFMRQLGVNPGDVVEIKGERITAAVVDRAYPGDIGLNIIRMDGNTRRNAKTSIGEIVYVKKAEVKPAKKVVIAPANKGIVVNAPPIFFKQGLLGKALVKGDLVALRKARRTFRVMNGPGRVDDLFSMLENQFPGFGFGDLKFFVVDTLPKKEIVVITEETEIELNPNAEEIKEEESATSLGINYEDIGGLREEIRKVQEMVELPLRHPEIFEKLGIEAPKGLLLHGPPGTGKTLLAKAVASETNAHFILINGPEIISKFYGQSEENLRKKFEEAEQNAPSIIFFDEIDAIATKREETKGDVEKRVVAQLLGLMDGLKSRGKVIVIAATNMPNLLDPALRRPGRFDREIEIGVPSKEGRLEILKIHTRNMPIEGSITPELIGEEIIESIEHKITTLNGEKQFKENLVSPLIENISKGKAEIENKKALIQPLQIKVSELELLQDKTPDEVKKFDQANQELAKLNLDLINKNKTLNEWEEQVNKITKDINSRKESISQCSELKELMVNSDNKRFELAQELINKYETWSVKVEKKEFKHSKSLDLLHALEVDQVIMDKAKQKGLRKDMEEIARITHGFVGADLSALAKEAAMIELRRKLPELKLLGKGKEADQPLPKEFLESLHIEKEHFIEALRSVRPSAMREVLVDKPDVNWKDIGGLEDVKNKLKEAVEWPLKNPEMFKRMGIRPPRGILLYGPPGTGKTMLAKAVAKESEANFILINGPSLLSKWVGESEKAVREIFRKARQTAPTILFFDEIDALVPKRGMGDGEGSKVNDKIVNQMLTEIDGLEALNDVLVIAATNRPDIIDPGLLRQGRFDRIIYTSVPSVESRKKIFEVHLGKMAIDMEEKKETKIKVNKGKKKKEETLLEEMPKGRQEEVSKLAQEMAEKTEGYVGSDIEGVCREAAMIALRESFTVKGIRREHLEKALDVVKASVDKEVETAYKQLENYFSAARAKQIKEKPNRDNYFG